MNLNGYAARYSTDIHADIARGYSFAGWGLTPASTVRAAWRDWMEYAAPNRLFEADDEDAALDAFIENAEYAGYHVEPMNGGYLVALPGLSAFFGETAGDAVAAAQCDPRDWTGFQLYVFPAVWIDRDPDADVFSPDTALVRPTGDPCGV